MKNKGYFFVLFFLAVATVTLLALESLSPDQTKKNFDRKTLVAAYTNEPPYAYYNDNGEVKGLFPAALRSMADSLGYAKIEWVMMTFEQLLPALLSNRVDVVAAGLVTTEQRKPFGCFLSPLARTHAAVMLSKNNTLSTPIQLTDLNARSLIVLSGSIEETLAVKLNLGKKIERVPDVQAGLSMLLTEKADALMLTRPTLEFRKRSLPSVDVFAIEELTSQSLEPAFLFSHRLKEKMAIAEQAQQEFMNTDEYHKYLYDFGFTRPTETSEISECQPSAVS